ncbi:MAG: hypothetical protein HY821_24045 [Acidobacteria bacterium]|nr:hypothetical protein [Acidobacteriota bacterium]
MNPSTSGRAPSTKRAIVVLIQLAIASLHALRCGRRLDGEWARLYSSYFSDLVIPFGVYFLLTLNEDYIPLFRSWSGKAGAVIVLTTAAEVAQFFGFDVLGVTFDPLDILMYASGTLLAALLDVQVFPRLVKGWNLPARL